MVIPAECCTKCADRFVNAVSPETDDITAVLEADFDAFVLTQAKQQSAKLAVMKIIESVQLQQTVVQMYLNSLQKPSSPTLRALQSSVAVAMDNYMGSDLQDLQGIALSIANQCVSAHVEQFSAQINHLKRSAPGAVPDSAAARTYRPAAPSKKKSKGARTVSPDSAVPHAACSSALLQSYHQSLELPAVDSVAAVLPSDFLEGEFLLMEGIAE